MSAWEQLHADLINLSCVLSLILCWLSFHLGWMLAHLVRDRIEDDE